MIDQLVYHFSNNNNLVDAIIVANLTINTNPPPKNLVIQDLANVNLMEHSMNDLAMIFLMSSRFLTNLSDMTLLTLFQMYSIGFRSGEYGGRNTRSMSRRSAWTIVAQAR